MVFERAIKLVVREQIIHGLYFCPNGLRRGLWGTLSPAECNCLFLPTRYDASPIYRVSIDLSLFSRLALLFLVA